MDNLKKNLHLVVLGGGILLGLILLYVGITIRGGAEEQLEERQASLTAAANPPSQGDLNHASERRDRFDESISTNEASLRGATTLLENFDPTMSVANFRGTSPDELRKLRGRFQVMADRQQNARMPELIEGYELEERSGRQADPFAELESQLSDTTGETLRNNWVRLRIAERLAATCESLIQVGADRGTGVRLVSLNIGDLGSTDGRDANQRPWLTADWKAELDCVPSFALLLMEELSAPSERTVPREGGAGAPPQAFPNFLRSFALQISQRPEEARFDIDREFKRNRNWPEDLDASTQEGRDRINEVRQELNELEILIPVRCELKLSAATFNPDWEALAEENGGT